MEKEKLSKFYVISGILGNYKDISPNMIEKILDTEVLFVEFIDEVLHCFREVGVHYTGKLIKLSNPIQEGDKKILLTCLLQNKNAGIFEIGGAACFADPGYQLLDFVFRLGFRPEKTFEIVPVPGTSALMTAISISGFHMDRFTFGGFISTMSYLEILSARVPMVFFSELCDPPEVFMGHISFMKNIDNRECFVGINLGKIYSKESKNRSNIIIRGLCGQVYEQLSLITSRYEDVPLEKVLIFNIERDIA